MHVYLYLYLSCHPCSGFVKPAVFNKNKQINGSFTLCLNKTDWRVWALSNWQTWHLPQVGHCCFLSFRGFHLFPCTSTAAVAAFRALQLLNQVSTLSCPVQYSKGLLHSTDPPSKKCPADVSYWRLYLEPWTVKLFSHQPNNLEVKVYAVPSACYLCLNSIRLVKSRLCAPSFAIFGSWNLRGKVRGGGDAQ